MFPAIIQFNYQINLPEKEVEFYIAQYSTAIQTDNRAISTINPEELQLFISSKRETLLSIQSLSDLKKDTSFDIQDIKAEVTLAKVKEEKASRKTQVHAFNITLTLFLKQFIVLGQLSNEDFLISTIDHLPDLLNRKPVPVQKLHHFKSLTINTYQLIRLN